MTKRGDDVKQLLSLSQKYICSYLCSPNIERVGITVISSNGKKLLTRVQGVGVLGVSVLRVSVRGGSCPGGLCPRTMYFCT